MKKRIGARKKGMRTERQILNLHLENGVLSRLVPQSGARAGEGDSFFHELHGDLLIKLSNECTLKGEVKSRKHSANGGWKMLENYLGEYNDLLFLKSNHKPLIICMTWDCYLKLLGKFPIAQQTDQAETKERKD